MTYQALLLHEDWKSKRSQIILRDNVRCNVCSNKNLLTSTFSGLLLFKGKTENGTLCGFLGSLSSGISSSKNIFIRKGSSNIPIKLSEGNIVYIDSESTNNQFLKVVAVRKAEVKDKLTLENRFNINHNHNEEEDVSEFSWKYVPGLHVHHKYYQVNLMPWQYPNDALQTLCWVCHEDLHKHNKIDLRDENGKVLGKLTPCHRCFGAGIFPEYKHIIAGLCFHCRGAKYEELIA